MTESSAMMIYKIIMLGPTGSGKSTFMKTISEIEVVNSREENNDPNREILTIPIDFGRITSHDAEVMLFLLESKSHRFDLIREILLEGSLGCIVMIDSRHPETFRETQHLVLKTVAQTSIHYVFAANFQDDLDAWSVDDLRIALRVPSEIPMLSCIAVDKDSVKQVLSAFLDYTLSMHHHDS